jgi:hypothetical protein
MSGECAIHEGRWCSCPPRKSLEELMQQKMTAPTGKSERCPTCGSLERMMWFSPGCNYNLRDPWHDKSCVVCGYTSGHRESCPGYFGDAPKPEPKSGRLRREAHELCRACEGELRVTPGGGHSRSNPEENRLSCLNAWHKRIDALADALVEAEKLAAGADEVRKRVLALERENAALRREVKVDDELLAERNRLLALFD